MDRDSMRASATNPAPVAITYAELAKIKPSPFNHRKIFKGLDELAESIKARGVLSPILVRPLGKDEYELVFGERRWRAAKLAGVAAIPAMVREMSDVEVLEAQLIENVQRADVHPIEEATGYQDLMVKHKYTVEQLVAKTGKSKAYVYARLKLCALAPTARDACLEGKLDASVALLIARIPSKELQERATKDILGGDEFEIWDLASDDGGAPPPEGLGEEHEHERQKRELTVREATALLHRKYMLRLELATFDPKDSTLVPKAGACIGCVKRTGSQPELFSDVKSADVCTDPTCFEAKKEAAWKALASKAKAEGHDVMSDTAAGKAFSKWNGQLEYSTPYIELDGKASYDVVGNANGGKTWEQVFGKDLPTITYARDPLGQIRRLVERDAAYAHLRKTGKLAKKSSNKPQKTQQQKAAEAGAKQREKAREVAIQLALEQVSAKAAAGVPEKKELALWHFMAVALAEQVGFNSRELVAARRGAGTGSQDSIGKLVKQLKTAGEFRGLVLELLAASDVNHYTGKSPLFDAACDLFGVDWKKCETAARELAKAEDAKPAAAAAKQCGDVDGKNSEPCFHAAGHDGRHSNGRRTWPAKKPAKKGAKK